MLKAQPDFSIKLWHFEVTHSKVLLDIKFLYTNVTNDEGIQAVQEILNTHTHTNAKNITLILVITTY